MNRRQSEVLQQVRARQLGDLRRRFIVGVNAFMRHRDLEADAAAQQGAALLAQVEATDPTLERRRAEAKAMAMLRARGWREVPDGNWVSPAGARMSFCAAVVQAKACEAK